MLHLRSFETCSVVVLIIAVASSSIAQPTDEPAVASITLEQALSLALENSPRLSVFRADIAEAEADLRGAKVFPENPVLDLSAGPRFGVGDLAGSDLGLDASVGLSQAIPLFGRWGAAVDVAEARLDAERSAVRFDTQRLLAAVSRAFLEAQRAEALVGVQRERTKLLQDLVALTERRVEAGDATQLDVNLWQAELGSARSSLLRFEGRAVAARAELAAGIGLDPKDPPLPQGALQPPKDPPAAALDLEQRSDLRALAAQVRAAERAVELARARAWPDLGVGAYLETEKLAPGPEGVTGEYLAGAQLTVPLPLFERNQGDIARAEAQLNRAKAVRAARLLAAAAEVETQSARLEAALAAARGLESSVVATTEETLSLLERSFEEGKIGITDLLLRQRTLLDARADYMDAIADARLAEIDLELAAGRLSTDLIDEMEVSP